MGQLKKSIFPDIAGEEAGKITARLCSPAPTGEETEAGKQTEAEKTGEPRWGTRHPQRSLFGAGSTSVEGALDENTCATVHVPM